MGGSSLIAASTGLCRGLDGALLAALARPAGQVVRGFIVELLARASRLEQRRAAAEQWAVAMGLHGAPQPT
jgi:hypothetical protein